MFNFSKSKCDSDLKNKTDIQFKVTTDWLRAIDSKVNKISRTLTVVMSLLEDDSQPSDMESIDDNRSNSESV